MKQYHQLLKEILERGNVQFEPRTEEYTLGISAWLSVYDLRQGFPLMTTKNIPPRLPSEELFWKLRGERNVKSLVDRNIHIWTANAFDRYLRTNNLREKFPKHSPEWNSEFEKYKERIANEPEFAKEAGDLGPVYGYQWRHWRTRDEKEIDQLAKLLKGIKEKPGSRYHVLSAWNVEDLPDMALGPCPFWHQFSVFGENMDLTMVQRSCDVFLGVPFNIAQDSLLLEMVAKETGFKRRFFNHSYINVHAYLGVPPRTNFWTSKENVREFQRRFEHINHRLEVINDPKEAEKTKEEFIQLKNWYLATAPPESPGNERKDHIPFILEQLALRPGNLPSVTLEEIPLLRAIQHPFEKVMKIENYNPQKWNSKATMAA